MPRPTSRSDGSNAAVLLLSFYESCLQPLTVATAAAYLRRAGFDVSVRDTYVDTLDDSILDSSDYLGVSIPLRQSLDKLLLYLPQLKESHKPIIAFGQHATVSSHALLSYGLADWVVRGDWELPLVELLKRLQEVHGKFQEIPGIRGVCRRGGSEIDAQSYLHRGPVFLPPDRKGIPPLNVYEYELVEQFLGEPKVVCNVETSRGCRQSCAYCSVYGAYAKKVVIIPKGIILEDIRNCIDQGAEHVCFVDAEFLSAADHGLEVVRAMHSEFPEVTFDFTTRADYLLERKNLVKELVSLGARFVTTAIEFPSDRILKLIDKGITVDQCVEAIRFCLGIGLAVYPTFIRFNPWVSVAEMSDISKFLQRAGLDEQVDSLQLRTRLSLPKGSPLLDSPALEGVQLEDRGFHYEWKHPDPEVDRLYEEVVGQQLGNGFRRCCIRC